MIRVLHVEDDDLKARMIERLLPVLARRRGLEVDLVRAHSLAEARGVFAGGALHAVVTDWHFPFFHGGEPDDERGRHVVRWAGYHELPVIVVSGSERPPTGATPSGLSGPAISWRTSGASWALSRKTTTESVSHWHTIAKPGNHTRTAQGRRRESEMETIKNSDIQCETCGGNCYGEPLRCIDCGVRRVVDVERTFDIPAVNFDRFEAMVADLAKRARRIKAAPIGFELLRTYKRRGEFLYRDHNSGEDVFRWVTMHEVRVFGPRPSFDGWELIGRLDFVAVPGACLRAMVPGEDCPPEFHDVDAERCDHCNVRRRRNDTFLVRHENGAVKVVGRTCLADFLGHESPEAIASICEIWGAFNREMSDSEEGLGGFGGYVCDAWEPEEILETAASVVRIEGWAPSAMMEASTKSMVLELLTPPNPRFDPGGRLEKARQKRLVKVTAGDRGLGRAALAWVREQDPSSSDYIFNLTTVLGENAVVTAKTAGIAVSAIVAYDRAMERETKRREREASFAEKAELTEYVGAVKDRIDTEGAVEMIRSWETQWGSTTLIKWRDDEGRVFVWKSSRDVDTRRGDRVKVRGTVKKHEDYRGEKQNVLTRCKLEVTVPAFSDDEDE